jgi:cytochrome c peroxidase
MKRHSVTWSVLFAGLAASIPAILSQDGGSRVSSYMPVKPEIMRRHRAVLDLPDHLLPEFPPPTRSDLRDESHGKLITIANYFELFNGILNPKQLEGLRLLLTPFPQQQFNLTEDRQAELPNRGVACFDCHANGHSNAAFHLAGDARPQRFRDRIDTTSLRGANIQRLFGSQRALKTVQDFTEFEQRGAYFDGGPVIATKKGVNILERGHFPPAPKLDIYGKLDSAKASAQEVRGHDGRLLTLDDAVEFFNIIQELTGQEKPDLVAFQRTL